jgi:copper chaperone CopZ
MKTLIFKTTLKCNGCIASVKPGLDAIEGLTKWEIEIAEPDRPLKAEVESDDVEEKIIQVLEKSGFKAWKQKD